MGGHDRPVATVEEAEHEYSFQQAGNTRTCIADVWYSYEALPPNFSLGANMLAGAFAGIAVRIRSRRDRWTPADGATGTLGHVPRRHAQGNATPREPCANHEWRTDCWLDADASHQPWADRDIP
jgi:hypothetical protein